METRLGGAALTHRFRRVLVSLLLCVAAAMAVAVYLQQQRAASIVAPPPSSAPLVSPADTALANVTLMLANDADGSLVSAQRNVALPQEPSLRARRLLNRLLEEYATPASAHPIAMSAGVDAVFLLPLPKPAGSPNPAPAPQGTLAVVNLSTSFAESHPSGIEPETMTLLSIIATLHANLPDVAEVRFLVDGEPRATLAGHADLTSTYLAASTAAPVPGAHP